VPRRLGIIGAGVIGLELGSVWRRLGAEVTVLEATDAFLPMADEAVSKEALKQLTRQGLDIRLGAKVSGATVSGDAVTVTYDDAKGSQSAEFDRVVVAIGRRPHTEGLAAEDVGLRFDGRGYIEVDEHCRTGIDGVYAVGDCVRGPMLAHKAKDEGIMAADLAAGRWGHVNYGTVPSVIYTAPEMAWVGQTEAQAKASGRTVKVGTFPFLASGRARAMEAAQGFVKLIAAADDDTILGVHIIGPMAGELIAEAVLALEYSATAEDLQRTMHAHPTLSEALHEAALAADKRAIDFPNR
jgi:dihydrolipoamide dehydrogenase